MYKSNQALPAVSGEQPFNLSILMIIYLQKLHPLEPE